MQHYSGVDVGSGYTKAVVIDERLAVVGRGLAPSGANFTEAATRAYDAALEEAKLTGDQVTRTVATGYGRTNVPFAHAQRTEIDCHARGAFHCVQRAITVIDIGGQDNKIIYLDKDGRRTDFAMNRKCAAGTGSFLEEIAFWLKIPLEEFSTLALGASVPDVSAAPAVSIGSYCTVFAKTEILAKVREGVSAADLARAALESVAKRVLETRVVSGPVVLTGGVVAHNPLIKDILARVLDSADVIVPAFPQHIGALGAALVAAQQ